MQKTSERLSPATVSCLWWSLLVVVSSRSSRVSFRQLLLLTPSGDMGTTSRPFVALWRRIQMEGNLYRVSSEPQRTAAGDRPFFGSIHVFTD